MSVFDLIAAGLALVLILAVVALLTLAFAGVRGAGVSTGRQRPRDH